MFTRLEYLGFNVPNASPVLQVVFTNVTVHVFSRNRLSTAMPFAGNVFIGGLGQDPMIVLWVGALYSVGHGRLAAL